MKKFLSFILALSIVLSCVSMVTFADKWTPGAEEETGLKISIIEDNNGANKYLRSGALGLSNDVIQEDTLDNGTVDRYVLFRFRVYNLNDTAVYLQMFAQGGSNGWKTVSTSYPGNSNATSYEQKIPANSHLIYNIKVPVNENNEVVNVESGTEVKKPVSSLSIRFDVGSTNGRVTTGQKFIIEALNEPAQAAVEIITVGKKTGGGSCFEVTEKINGTAAYAEYIKAVKLTVTNQNANNSGMVVFGTSNTYDTSVKPKQLTRVNPDGYVFADCPDYTGPLTVSYMVYNPTDRDLSAGLRFTRREYWGYNAGNGLSTSEIIIPAQSKAILTNSINVTNGMVTLDSMTIPASEIRVRMNLNFKKLINGECYYIEPLSDTAHNDPMFLDTSSNNGFSRTVVGASALPELTEYVEATPVPVVAKQLNIVSAPTKTDYELGEKLNKDGLALELEYSDGSKVPVTEGYTVSELDSTTVGVKKITVTYGDFSASFNVTVLDRVTGYKFTPSSDSKGSAHYFTFEDYKFEADDTFTGRKSFSYTFYNTGATTIKNASIRVVELIVEKVPDVNDTDKDGDTEELIVINGWQYVNLEEVSNVLPGEKVTLTTYADFINGKTTIGVVEPRLDQISVRFDVTFANETTDGTSSVIIAPTVHDDNDFLLMSQRSFSKAVNEKYRGALPEFECQISSISANADKTTYEYGEAFDTDGLSVTINYQDGTHKDITEGFTVSEFNPETIGEQTITVSYADGKYTDTFTVTVKEPKYAGVKYTFNSNADAHKKKTLSLNNTVHFTDENVATFTGDVSKTYTFYNHSDKMVVVTLNFAARVYHVVDGTVDMTKAEWVYAAASKYKTASILPGQSITLTITEQFVDGAPVEGYAAINFKYNSLTIEDLFPQISVTFVTAAEAGDVIVIGTDDAEDAIFTTGSTFGTKETAENLITLPELQKVDLNAAYKFEVNTTTTTPNYPRISKLGLTTDDIIVDENGRCILLQYRVYNMSGTIKYFIVQAQNGWLGIENIITYPGNRNGESLQAIQPYSSAVYTVRIAIDENNKVNGNNLEDISIRFIETLGGNKILKFDENGNPIYQIDEKTGEIIKDKDGNPVQDFYYDTNPVEKVKFAGEVYYIQALNEVSRNIFYQNPTGCSNFTLTTITDAELDKITKFAGVTPEIGSSIALNIVTVPMHDYIDGARLKVTRYNGTDDPYVVYLDPIDVVTLGNITYKKSYGTLVFRYKGINAQCLADDITFELVYGEDNKTVATAMDKNGEVLKYSIKQYALNQYANGSAELKQLLNDMLVYGAAAQDYMNYREDNLATAGVEWISETTLNVEALNSVKDVTNNVDKAITRAGLEISYVNKIYFRVDETKVDLAKIWVTKNNGEAVAFSLEGNVIYTDAIKANGFDDVYTINVTLLDGTVASVQYNVNAYIANKYNSETVGAITTALGNYGAAAVAYQASLNA